MPKAHREVILQDVNAAIEHVLRQARLKALADEREKKGLKYIV